MAILYQSGYPKELCLSVNSSLLCGICNKILNKPMQSLNCGHRFCEFCINEEKQRLQVFNCPSCQNDNEITEIDLTEEGQIFADRGVFRELNRLSVNCIFCRDKMELKQWPDHLRHCKEVPKPCPRGCGMEISPSERKSHELVCEERDEQCRKCGENVKLKDMSDHLVRECSSLFSQCQYCGQRVLIAEKKKHHESGECPIDWSSGCPFGCLPVSIKEADLDSHRRDNVAMHLDRMLARNSNPQERDSVLNECVKHLAQAIAVTNLQHDRIQRLEENLRQASIQMTEQELRLAACLEELRCLKSSSIDGSLMWRIDGFSEKRVAAISNKCPSIFSPPFYTSANGYQMCARMYLNGDGAGHNTHLSLFFVLMKGPFDPLLRWPFQQKVTFLLKDQKNHADVVDAFRPEPSGESFRRPTSLMNVASGNPKFLPLADLDDPTKGYVVDDVMFVKIIVDCSTLL